MKADCQGMVREPRGSERREGEEEEEEGEEVERARESKRERAETKGREKDRAESQVIAALVGLGPRGPLMSGCAEEGERCLWTFWR